MSGFGRICLCTMALVMATATSAHADKTPEEQLEGIEAQCARDVVDATWETMRDRSWSQLAELLSFGGAAEMAALLGDTVRAELRDCFVDVYRLGYEDGRRDAAAQDEPEPDYPVEP